MPLNKFTYNQPFPLECGTSLPGFELAYHSWGTLNEEGDNVIWICHAFTANSDAHDWWPGMIGEGCVFDPSRYFIICVNILGSCYGTTGPLSVNPKTGKPWYREFPLITVRDVVESLDMLRRHLKIRKLYAIVGGSVGGHQALEYSIMFPDLVKNLIFIVSGAFYLPWAIAFDEAQRMAIQADHTFYHDVPEGGREGLKSARAMALLSYRNRHTYNLTQKETNLDKLDAYKASSYQVHQGQKLVNRFNAYSYFTLTKMVDSHHIGRGRGSAEEALQRVKAKTLSIGITTDILFPPEEQKFVAEHIPDASYHEVDTPYGHDGFLIETPTISALINNFINPVKNQEKI